MFKFSNKIYFVTRNHTIMSIFSPEALLKIKPKFTNYPKPYLNENNLVNSYAFQLAFQTSYGGEGHKSSIYLFTQVQIQQNNNYYNVRQEDLSCVLSHLYTVLIVLVVSE